MLVIVIFTSAVTAGALSWIVIYRDGATVGEASASVLVGMAVGMMVGAVTNAALNAAVASLSY